MTALFSTCELEKLNSGFWERIHASVQQRGRGQSLLHDLAREGDVLSAEILIDEGLNVNVSDDFGHKPLHTAAFFGHSEMVALLLERGAVLDAAIQPFGHTALMQAVRQGHADVARLLLAHGACIAVKDRLNGEGLLHVAARNGDMKMAGILIASGINVLAETQKGETARDIAGRHHHAALESVLLKVMQHHACYSA